MATQVEKLTGLELKSSRLLEVGPGHGYFADVVREMGGDYSFDDISESVVGAMERLGFRRVGDGENQFDVVWLSHVLEHSTDWTSARMLLKESLCRTRPGGYVVVIAPDYLSSGKYFFDSDATHGYPTTLRTVAQLMRDVGLNVSVALHHRGGSFHATPRAVYALISLLPNSLGKKLLARRKMASADHPLYSWKTVMGWRQVLVIGTVKTSS